MEKLVGVFRMPLFASDAPLWINQISQDIGRNSISELENAPIFRKLPVSIPSILPVFQKDNGEKFCLVNAGNASFVADLIAEPCADSEKFLSGTGGYMPVEQVQKDVGVSTDDDARLVSALNLAAQNLLLNPPVEIRRYLADLESKVVPVTDRSQSRQSGEGDRHPSDYDNPVQSRPRNANHVSGYENPPTKASQAESKKPSIAQPQDPQESWPLSPVQQYLLGQGVAAGIASLLSGGTIKDTLNSSLQNSLGNLPALGMFFASQFVGEQVQSLFDSWKVDDESSTGEHAAKFLSQMICSKLQEEVLGLVSSVLFPGGASAGFLQKINTFFNGLTSAANLEAATLNTPDDKGNVVLATTFPNVLTNGLPSAVAFTGDLMTPAAKPILEGSISVFLGGGKMFARFGSKTNVPSGLLSSGPANVFIGGKSPPPAATNAAAEILNAGGTVVKSIESAEKKSQELTARSEAVRHQALNEGKSPEEAERLGNQAAEDAAHTPELDPRTAATLNRLTYRDGTDGEGADAPELKEGDKYSINGQKWEVLDINDANDEGSTLPAGYRSVLFRNPETGQTVLVPQGTNVRSGADWFNNLLQGVGFVPPHYQQIADEAQRYRNQYPGLVIAGHSLGGGLATYGGQMAGLPIITFNPAGLGTGSSGQLSNGGFMNFPNPPQNNVTVYDALTGFSVWIGQPSPIGPTQIFPGNGPLNQIDNHDVANFPFYPPIPVVLLPK